MRESTDGDLEAADESIEGLAELDELLASIEPGDFEPPPAEPELPERPQPVSYVTRELRGPDGSLVRVEVPVYAASEGRAPEPSEPKERDADAAASPVTEDLYALLAAEDADD